MKRYTSFEEIDRDLKWLHLQSQIDKEELKINFNETKESLSPSNLVTGLIGGAATGAVVFKVLSPLLGLGVSYLASKIGKR
ncbi:DUF6327 family protein [Constantimarinum furrinae]|uniref:Uncharacterized protein n=1 Tax=Constantimarinum furrinae TaxID=2562285 RepID=A0A7G8PT35_9FLAO|nr:DUF6327 family protein [Constantimarinum furrinae]QNJ97501.1 hypothetical protein ALE3EI_0926 [Constantimarinum furrinae]